MTDSRRALLIRDHDDDRFFCRVTYEVLADFDGAIRTCRRINISESSRRIRAEIESRAVELHGRGLRVVVINRRFGSS